jgi:UDP-GlcNAc:undecaprenyl-phosphate/decaprenyl-phosphate GlcNAc-1-phosphate transferase
VTVATPFLFAFVVSAVLVSVCRAVAFRLGCVIQPKEDHFHSRAVALLGGVGIAGSLFAASFAFGLVDAVPLLLVGSGILMVVGITHDLLNLKPYTKLVAMIALASVFLVFDYRLHWANSITLDSILTVFWIVGIISAFNLLDNMDGLCGGIALIAGTAFLVSLLPTDPGSARFLEVQYLAILLGAIAGFLIYNVHPASVSMGDSGSLLIGLNMAAVPLHVAPGSGTDLLSIVAVPVLVLLIPIADAVLVTFSRLLAGRSAAARSRDHSSHRLVAIGLSERTAVGLLWVLAGVSGLIGVTAARTDQGLTALMAMTFIIGTGLFAVYLSRVHVYENVDPTSLPGKMTPLLVEFVARRRIAEVVLDLVLVAVSYYGAYRLRFEGVQYSPNFEYFLQSFPIVVGTQMIALFVAGAYRGIWRYFSLADGVTFVKSVFLGAITSQVLILYLYDFRGYAQSVFIVYGMLLVLLLVGSRASFRLISEFVQRQRRVGRRLVIYGAGDAGAMAVRQVLADPHTVYRILGFVDDDVTKRNVRVHGYRVIGTSSNLLDMIMGGGVDAVVVTHSSGMEALELTCARYGVTLYQLRFDWREVHARPTSASDTSVPAVHVIRPASEQPSDESAIVRHAFSVDVEDWFHGIPMANTMKDAAPPRLERGLHVLLDLLAEHDARATFFILGPLVQKHPAVITRIAAEGHELGCHGWSHDLVYQMTPERFGEEARRSRDEISALTGCPVLAYRAPYFSITRDSMWALDVLADLGFKYDSSVFPVRNWRYGIADFNRDPVLLQTPSGPLWEFPISVMDRYGQTIPVSGGAYFRLYPYSLTRSNFRAQERVGRSVIFYLHPWELDPDHPQVSFAWRPRLTHYANLQSTRPKLVRLLRDFKFGSISDVIAARV